MSGLEILFCTSAFNMAVVPALHDTRRPAKFSHQYSVSTEGIGQSLWPSSLWRGATADRFWDCRFESRREHGRLSLASVVCCQVEVSATGRSLVQKSSTECGDSECDHEESIIRRPWPTRGSCCTEKFEGDIPNADYFKHVTDNSSLNKSQNILYGVSLRYHTTFPPPSNQGTEWGRETLENSAFTYILEGIFPSSM